MVSLSIQLPFSPSKTKFAQYQRNLSLLKIFSNPEVKSFFLRSSDSKLYLSSKNYKNQNKLLSIISLKESEKMVKEKEEEVDGMREERQMERERNKQEEEVDKEKNMEEKNERNKRKKWMKEEEHGRSRREDEGQEKKEGNMRREEDGWKRKREEIGKKSGKQQEVKWENCQNYFFTPGMSELNVTKKDGVSGKSFFILRKVNLSYSQHQSSLLSEKKKEEVERRRANEERGMRNEEDEGERKKEEGRRNEDHDNMKRNRRWEKDERREEKGEKVAEKLKEEEEGGVRRRIKGLRGFVGRKDHNISSSYFRELKGKKLSFQNEEDRKELVDFFHADKGYNEGKEDSKSTLLPKIRSNNSFQKSENKVFSKTIRKEESSSSFLTNKSGGKREEGGGKGGGKKEAGGRKEGEGGIKGLERREDDKFPIDSFEVKGEGVYDGEEDFLKYVNRIKFSD